MGRVEDLAGVVIVGIILFSALVAGWQAVDRLFNPREIGYLGWVAAAGVIGFIGNEVVAVFRIRVGREIDSAALIADGYHARVDGLTSLAVVLGAAGVWLGFPLADPIVGLIITIMILGIVWQSGNAVFTRMLDGTEPHVVSDVRHAAEHVDGVRAIDDIRARWIGHRLAVEMDIGIDGAATVQQAETVTAALERELRAHLPALGRTRVRIRPVGELGRAGAGAGGHRHHDHAHNHAHAPDPQRDNKPVG
jgi:cation diffusion facilitator family transporter